MAAGAHSPLQILRESAAPSSSDVEREFYQQRIAVFGKVGCLLSVVFYLMVNVLSQLGQPRSALSWVADVSNASTLGVAAVLGLLWLVGRGRPRSAATLRVLDVGGTLAICAGSAVHGWLGWEFAGFRFNALMAITNILIFRAILSPRGLRTGRAPSTAPRPTSRRSRSRPPRRRITAPISTPWGSPATCCWPAYIPTAARRWWRSS